MEGPFRNVGGELGPVGADYSWGTSSQGHDTQPDRALILLTTAADAGHNDAKNVLGCRLMFSDRERARQYLTEAATDGCVEAMYNLSPLLLSEDIAEAEKWMSAAMREGMPEAVDGLRTVRSFKPRIERKRDLFRPRKWRRTL